jgi:hypothetical protein
VAAASTVSADPLRIEVLGGGVIQLGSLTSIVPQAGNSVEIVAQDSESRVELPALTDFLAQSGSSGSFLQADDGGVIHLNDGLTNLSGDVDLPLTQTGVIQVGSLELASGASLSGKGTLAASLINGGVIRPGAAGAPGQVIVQGDYQQTAEGALAVELGGDVPGEGYDQLIIEGQASIAGSLEVSQLAGYIPVAGSTFDVLTSTTLSGAFTNVSGLDWPGGGTLTLTYRNGSIIR